MPELRRKPVAAFGKTIECVGNSWKECLLLGCKEDSTRPDYLDSTASGNRPSAPFIEQKETARDLGREQDRGCLAGIEGESQRIQIFGVRKGDGLKPTLFDRSVQHTRARPVVGDPQLVKNLAGDPNPPVEPAKQVQKADSRQADQRACIAYYGEVAQPAALTSASRSSGG
jgi:hypothetical protein